MRIDFVWDEKLRHFGPAVAALGQADLLLAKRFVLKFEADQFRLLMDGLMLISGAAMLWAAVH
jgi:hypothetical protein